MSPVPLILSQGFLEAAFEIVRVLCMQQVGGRARLRAGASPVAAPVAQALHSIIPHTGQDGDSGGKEATPSCAPICSSLCGQGNNDLHHIILLTLSMR